MKIVSDDALLLDELYVELKKEHIKATKETKTEKGAMSDEITQALELLVMGIGVIEMVITKINAWRASRRINYLHYKVKDGIEVKLNHLTDEQIEEFFEHLRKNVDKLEYIDTGINEQK
ncbi:MAG: hypothetical protein JXQ76_02110 [Campylobacterales bacterium]|nr:hypothetical protein [Campylobacterales bacterium]